MQHHVLKISPSCFHVEIFQDVIMEKSILVPGSHLGGGSEETYYILATCIFPIKTKRCFFNLVHIYIMIRNPTEEGGNASVGCTRAQVIICAHTGKIAALLSHDHV